VAAGSPRSLAAQRDLAMARKKLAAVRLSAGDWAGAAALFAQVLAFHSSVAAEHPKDAGAEVDRAGSDVNLGIAWGLGRRISDGLAQCEKGLAVLERLSAADPSNVQLKNKVGVACIWVGNLAGATAAGRPRGLEAFRKSISLYEGLSATEPANPYWRQKAADGYLGASEVAGKLGRWPEALQAARRGQAIYTSLEAADPKSAYFRGERAALQVLNAQALIGLGDLESARPLLHSAEEALKRLSASDAENAFHLARLAETQGALGQLHQLEAARTTNPARQREHHRRALEWLRQADAHYRVLAAQGRLPMGSTDQVDIVRRRMAECEAALQAAGRPQP
jgi:tetratricopeptide (TPR) repeat protein